MADNVSLNSMTGGDTAGADDIAGVKYQRVKLIHGADGVNDGDVSTTNPLPITFTKSATVFDLTTTPLGIAGSYTSATFDHSLNGSFVSHYIYADVDGTHYYEESYDGTTWTISDTEVVAGGVALRENHQTTAKYSRARYVNGGTAQATFIHQAIQRFIGQDEYVKISSDQNAITGNKTSNAQAPSTNNLGVLPAIALAAAPSYTEGMQVLPRVKLDGDLIVSLDGESVPVTGTFYQATQPVSLATAPSTPVTNAGTFAVQATLAAETTKVIGTVNVAAAQSIAVTQATPGNLNATVVGTGTFVTQSTLAAETTKVIGTVNVSTGQTITDVPAASGGLSKFHLVSAASTNATNLKASAGQVYAITAFNLNAAPMYLKFHNTAGTPTAGTGITDTYMIPGATTGAGVVINIDKGIIFTTGIGITLVTGITDASAVAVAASEIVLNIYFK